MKHIIVIHLYEGLVEEVFSSDEDTTVFVTDTEYPNEYPSFEINQPLHKVF